MRIALIYGKGLDGCGVQRGGIEMISWARKNGHECDLFYVDERSFARGRSHGDISGYHRMSREDFSDCAEKIDRDYDVVIVNSYPSVKHEDATIQSFYHDFLKKLRRPVVVGMMHEIYRGTIDRIPNLLLILNQCDVVMNFSEDTTFSREFSTIFPSKKLHERVKRFKLWTDVDELVKKSESYGIVDKKKRLTYMGRWTTMKEPARVLNLAPLLVERDHEFKTLLIGIEASIGAKQDIIDHPQSYYYKNVRGYSHEIPEPPDPSKTPVYGPYDHHVGMRIMSESMFGASFYRLLKNKNDYGDRMEYTQIEMIALGSIPVFDADFGANNRTASGSTYDSYDRLAVWSRSDDLESTADALVRLANDADERRAYRIAGLDFIRDEFESSVVLPAMLEEIMSAGKDADKYDDLTALSIVFGDENKGKTAHDLFALGPIPLGMIEYESKIVTRFKDSTSRARIPVDVKHGNSVENFFE